ncbi:methyl-accepting chemotaxis protein [Phycobacter sp. K97]|uniref:methyl-accepting chemotaxis protein n=1 Tax=Phycobacter sedimenti TaxID=3133977 RepID=UPI0031204EC4
MIRKLGSAVFRRLNVLSSIRGKITFILLALTATAGGAGYMIYQSFDRVSISVTEMTSDDLPKLAQSNALIAAAAKTKDAMITVMMAQNDEELSAAASEVDKSQAALQDAITALPPEAQTEFEAVLGQVQGTLRTSIQAREDVFKNSERFGEMTTELQDLTAGLQGVLLETADDAYFNISINGEDTITSIEDTMVDLVENKFAALQSLLEIRSEINLISGVALALATTRDDATISILRDLAVSSRDRLTGSIDVLSGTDSGLAIVEDLDAVLSTLDGVITSFGTTQRVDSNAVLSARQSADVALASAVDDMVFELTIAADDASTNNRDTVQSLLDNEVAFMNTLLEINSKLGTFQIEALKIATADTVEQAKVSQKALSAAAMALTGYREFGDGVLANGLDGIDAMADPDAGLAHFRIQSLLADGTAAQAADDTARAVLEISGLASLRGFASQKAISDRAIDIAKDSTEVKRNLVTLGWVGSAFVFCALVLNHFLIARPLNRISLTTERLSQGDMSPVTGFDRASDEIARIAGALKVFRDGLVEKEELARIADEERAANQARQTAAVTAIGTGLEHLARGDLAYRIEEELTEGYAKLKEDFNTTAETLNLTVVDVVAVAESIRSGSSEISQAADDLSHRTESQAATLEQTAAALEQLTASVRSAADGARDAAATTQDARTEASESSDVVKSTVKAMKDIEESSGQISQIIGVIDDIAFQTNLLALNAGVEAARAGDAGRGFAVVASEVRSLSQRTTDAAREIKELITKSSAQVENGVDLVDRAGQALESIAERVTHISGLVSNIADATGEQATGLAEANIAISQLDQVTQQNAAMVEETTAAGHLLSNDAGKLAQLMAGFAVSTRPQAGDSGASDLSALQPDDLPLAQRASA